MKVISVDFHELIRRFTVNLLKIQEYLEEQRFYLSPQLKDCFNTIIPCKSKVLYGIKCDKCKVCNARDTQLKKKSPCLVCKHQEGAQL